MVSLFSVGNTKTKRDCGIHFFNYIKIKWSTWISYIFKAALYYSLLYRSMHFWCHVTMKKVFSIESLNLFWNKQTNMNKLGPLSRVFQIALTGRRMGNFPSGGGNQTRSDIDHSNPFQSYKQDSVNIEHWLKWKSAWPVCTKSVKVK